MTGLRGAVERDDIPEVETIIETRVQAREPYLAYPVLAGLHMLSRKGSDRPGMPGGEGSDHLDAPAPDGGGWNRLDGLSTAQKRKALAIHYCFSAHMLVDLDGFTSAVRPSDDWHRRLFNQDPDLVLEVLHECAVREIRAGLEHPPGLQNLDDMEHWTSRRAATAPLASKDHVPDDCSDRLLHHRELRLPYVSEGHMPDSCSDNGLTDTENADSDDDAILSSRIHDVRLRLLKAYPNGFPDEHGAEDRHHRHRRGRRHVRRTRLAVLVDANLLLYAIDGTSPHNADAALWLTTVLEGNRRVGLAWQSLGAFLRISTNLRVYARCRVRRG